MAEKIISEFFDVAKIKGEINEIAAEMSKKFGAAANINTLGGKSTTSKGGGQKAEFDEIVEANKRLVKQLNEYKVQMDIVSKATAQARVETNNLNAQQKLQGTIYAKNSTELQKLDAQIKLLNIDLQRLVSSKQTESKAYTDGMAKMRQLSNEYDRMSKASGQAMLKTSSMYGATFSLTQVMRELPNFAIDARIGFMALSNNLPMLAENFTRVTKEIDEITGKEKGFKGAFKEFGKSLLSLNTIMIVASTLLVLFGDDIMEFLGNLGKGEKQINRFAESLLKIGNAVSEKSKSNMEEAIKFSVSYYTAVKKGDTERIKQLEDIAAKEYNIHKDRITQIGENINNWRIAFDEYIKMAQATYFNEMRIKEGAELEYENKKKAAQRDKILKEIENRYGVLKAESVKQGNNPFANPFGEASGMANEWRKLNNEIIESNKQLKALSMINLKPIDMMLDKTLKPEKQKKQKETFNFERTKTEPLKGVNLRSLSVPVDEIKRNELNLGDGMSQSINTMMALNNESYRNGLKSYSDYFKRRKEIYELAAKNEIKIQFDTVEEQAKIDDEHRDRMYENIQQGLDLTFELIRGFYDKYFELLEEEKEKQIKIEDEKLADIEDRERAGIITKQQAEEEKANTASYYAQVDEELERKKKEKEKEAFLLEQAVKLGQVWINFAAAAGSLENMLALGTLTPLYLTQALFSTGLIAAQSIPAFAEGGDMPFSGKAMLGDGGKHELAISPSGKMFISDNTPKLYELEKGTHIFPDVNKVDLMSVLAMKQVMPNMGAKADDKLMRELISTVKGQKQGNFYGMPLIRQMNMSQRYYSRKRGLMN